MVLHAVARDDYFITLAELDGFIEAQDFELLAIIEDFNVDHDCGSPIKELLKSFMLDHHLSTADLAFQQFINFTYESVDG